MVFAGERCGDYANLPFEKHVELLKSALKLSDQVADKILSGKKISLKSGLPLAQMEQQKQAFAKFGIVTEHQIQLSPKVLKMGLRSTLAQASISVVSENSDVKLETAKSSEISKENSRPAFDSSADTLENTDVDLESPVFQIDDGLKAPAVFRRSNEQNIYVDYATVKDKNNEPEPISVYDAQYQFNGLLLILLSAWAAWVLQPYVASAVTSLATNFGVSDIIGTVFGAVFFLASVLMLPRLFQPLLNTSVLFDWGEVDLHELTELYLGRRCFRWRAHESSGIFKIYADAASAESGGEELYRWNTQTVISNLSAESLKEFQSAFNDEESLKGKQSRKKHSAFDRFKPLISGWLPSNIESAINWSNEPASVVIDKHGAAVALIYERGNTAYRIISRERMLDEALHVFCLLIHRRGWV